MKARSQPPRRCPRCGAPAEPLQEACLQCGAPLPGRTRLTAQLGGGWRRLVPLLVLALVAVGATAVALGARHARNRATPQLIGAATGGVVATSVASSSQVTVSLGTTTARTTTTAPTVQTPTGPQPTISTGTLPVAPGAPSTTVRTTPPPTTTASRPPANGVASWPRGRAGWTVILESLPESSGRSAALGRARAAQHAGVAGVGLLLSSDYATLHAGYWVVFAGVYASEAAAQGGVASAHAHGYAGAYPGQVAP
ncbi:MAG TPA: zinc ribbon domain-containing protein [Gaiellaceae bacterium]|nr:zinc ribbon domain-containing protein [Gaiellaceae bacterium]